VLIVGDDREATSLDDDLGQRVRLGDVGVVRDDGHHVVRLDGHADRGDQFGVAT
jgi:hypothetical protein